MRIVCPVCGRVLGDTVKSIDCNINCRGCRKPVAIKMNVKTMRVDYLPEKKGGE